MLKMIWQAIVDLTPKFEFTDTGGTLEWMRMKLFFYGRDCDVNEENML